MKKLLLLGGSSYLLPAIECAHKLGVYVITCDYLPDNIAHQYSDEYRNVSIVDKDAVLALAKELQVDGIMSYATDPGVVVAAYVAEQLGLPTSPYESVALLQNKGKFRAFLKENGFNVPAAKTYVKVEDAIQDVGEFRFPIIVKPVDSAGSKGVTRVDTTEELWAAAKYALQYSLTSEFIVEEFLEKDGCSTDTDSFSVDGELVFCSFDDQMFDAKAPNPYTPSAYAWPSTMPLWAQNELRSELQRLIKLLNMKSTIYNIETRVCTDGKAYIMECTPRAGGNRLSEVLRMATGQDIIMASVKAALGMEIDPLKDPEYDGYWGEIILHSEVDGVFKELEVDDSVKHMVQEVDLWVKEGDEIHSFTGANNAIGTVIVKCASREELNNILENVSSLFRIFA